MFERIGEHPNIVAFHEAFFEDCSSFVVLELCEASLAKRLNSFIDSGVGFHAVFRGMLLGLAHVHQNGVVHRDLKPDNVLIGAGGGPVKLADFGVAAALPAEGLLRKVAGSSPYMSPEMLSLKGYGFGTDVWSLGVIVYLLLFGAHPYDEGHRALDDDEVERVIEQGAIRPSFSPRHGRLPHHGQHAESFSKELLKRQAASRCSSERALGLPYLASTPAQSLSREEYMLCRARHSRAAPVQLDVQRVQEPQDEEPDAADQFWRTAGLSPLQGDMQKDDEDKHSGKAAYLELSDVSTASGGDDSPAESASRMLQSTAQQSAESSCKMNI